MKKLTSLVVMSLILSMSFITAPQLHAEEDSDTTTDTTTTEYSAAEWRMKLREVTLEYREARRAYRDTVRECKELSFPDDIRSCQREARDELRSLRDGLVDERRMIRENMRKRVTYSDRAAEVRQGRDGCTRMDSREEKEECLKELREQRGLDDEDEETMEEDDADQDDQSSTEEESDDDDSDEEESTLNDGRSRARR